LDASAGLLHCHMNNLAHLDVRAANFLLTQEGGRIRATISDFGLSRFVEAGWAHTGRRGTASTEEQIPLMWSAPESMTDRVFSLESDVYMFGIFLFEIVARTLPYPDYSPAEFAKLDLDELSVMRPTIPEWTPVRWQVLMQSCWNPKLDKRPTIAEVNGELESFLAECRRADVLNLFRLPPPAIVVGDMSGVGAGVEGIPFQLIKKGSRLRPLPQEFYVQPGTVVV